jgi:hypothetical protein
MHSSWKNEKMDYSSVEILSNGLQPVLAENYLSAEV